MNILIVKKFKNNYQFSDIQDLKTPNQLSHLLGISTKKLNKLVNNVEKYYDPFVDSVTGRNIDKPLGDLKKTQKKITDRILKLYPISEVSYGGVEGKSIKLNAKNHINRPVVVRLDLSKCFHSIPKKYVYETFRKKFNYSHAVSKRLTELCTYRGSIPVGSPLSSMLVNIVLDDLWRDAQKIAENNKCKLTVWVDDIVISGPNAHKLIQPIKTLVNNKRLKIGWHKREIMRNNVLQQVTGCSVNTMLGVPKEKRQEYFKKALTKPKDKVIVMTGQINFLKFINYKQGYQLMRLVNKLNENKHGS